MEKGGGQDVMLAAKLKETLLELIISFTFPQTTG